MVDVMNLKNIAHHYHEIEGLLMHTHEAEKNTAYHVIISFDKDDNEIKRSSFLNFAHNYKEY